MHVLQSDARTRRTLKAFAKTKSTRLDFARSAAQCGASSHRSFASEPILDLQVKIDIDFVGFV